MGLHVHFNVYRSQWASSSSSYTCYFMRFVPRAQAPICRSNVQMPPCCNEFVCCVLCVGSGKWEDSTQYIIRSRMGYQQLNDEEWIMYPVYHILWKKLRHAFVLVRVRLAPCALAGGMQTYCCLLWCRPGTFFVQMRCYTLLYTFPWHNVHGYCD